MGAGGYRPSQDPLMKTAVNAANQAYELNRQEKPAGKGGRSFGIVAGIVLIGLLAVIITLFAVM